SSASFLGLVRARLAFLYWELPMTSATRRSAHAAPAQSTTARATHSAATPDGMSLFMRCSASWFDLSYLSKKCSSEGASHCRAPLRDKGGRPVVVTVTLIGLE